MDNKILLPLDNIFKFYAMFGLLLLVFSIGSLVYVSNNTNELVFAASIDYENLKIAEKPSAVDLKKIKILERKIEIASKDKDFYVKALGAIAGIGIYLMFYGFKKWHAEIQPMIDERAQLELEKLRLEIRKLAGPAGEPPPA